LKGSEGLSLAPRDHRLSQGRDRSLAEQGQDPEFHRLSFAPLGRAAEPCAPAIAPLTRIVNGHPNRDIDQLLPWAYRKQELKAVA
jgi:hypothetical protein